jgi:hypothetical protein
LFVGPLFGIGLGFVPFFIFFFALPFFDFGILNSIERLNY